MKGNVQRFYPDKGFGFISVAGDRDHFFHIDDAVNFKAANVYNGMEVEFESTDTVKGKRALLVTA